MPYSDPEKRRAYYRPYMRNRRKFIENEGKVDEVLNKLGWKKIHMPEPQWVDVDLELL